MGKLSFYHYRVANSKPKNKIFYFELLIWKMKKKQWFRSCSRFLYWNEILHNSELFIGMWDYVILSIDLSLNINRGCLGSWDYSGHALCCAVMVFDKSFCY